MSTNQWFGRLAAMALIAGAASSLAAEWTLDDGARAHPPYLGTVPAKSDVIFSTRFKRDQAPAVAAAFGANRIEWVYSAEPDFVGQLKAVTPWFGGTINANGPLPNDDGMARDFDGNVIVVPWMKGWNGRWITTTHPQTQKVLDDQVQRFIELGARAIQVDDPILQVHPALFQAGDFNASTQAGFESFIGRYPNKSVVAAAGLADFRGPYREYLKSRFGVKDSADYIKRFRSFPSTRLWLEYIRQTVEQHYTALRERLRKAGGVVLSMNLTTVTEPNEGNRLFFLTPYADYAISETLVKDYPTLLSQAATMRALGLGFAPSIQPLELADNRVVLATLYALGSPPVVPWDTYIGNDEAGKAKRYFGKPEELADVYRFARDQRELLDGHELDAVVAIVVPVDKYKSDVVKDLIGRLAARQVPFTFVATGGRDRRQQPERNQFKQVKLLITTNPDADYDAAALEAMRASQTPHVPAGQIDGAALDKLQPFLIAPGAETVRLFPRSVPERPGHLSLHVIDTTRGGLPTGDTACKRRLGIRNDFLPGAKLASATWVTGATSRKLDIERAPQVSYVSIDDCPLWGILKLQLAR